MNDGRLQKTIGAVARAARERIGLNQSQVARLAGISPQVYGRIERGLMLPAVPTLRKICTALGISADALLDLKSSEVSRSVKEPPPSELTPEARQLVHLVRGLPPEKVKALLRVVSVVRSVIEE
ncbi:MAG TPA: helix-turn-helix domain-containing protein [Myxococcaceae bacterium]|nr:helix-turn-helix domain-containing protein [Myxococcaceae bacterium]